MKEFSESSKAVKMATLIHIQLQGGHFQDSFEPPLNNYPLQKLLSKYEASTFTLYIVKGTIKQSNSTSKIKEGLILSTTLHVFTGLKDGTADLKKKFGECHAARHSHILVSLSTIIEDIINLGCSCCSIDVPD